MKKHLRGGWDAVFSTHNRNAKIMNTPLTAAYIAKQSQVLSSFPENVQFRFSPTLRLIVDAIKCGIRINGSMFAHLRINKTAHLVKILGMDLETARTINAVDVAECQAAFAEYSAACE